MRCGVCERVRATPSGRPRCSAPIQAWDLAASAAATASVCSWASPLAVCKHKSAGMPPAPTLWLRFNFLRDELPRAHRNHLSEEPAWGRAPLAALLAINERLHESPR